MSEYSEHEETSEDGSGSTVAASPSGPGDIVSDFDPEFAGQQIVNKEKRVVLRDEDGNELDPKLVESLAAEGKVDIRTVVKKKDRLVDSAGNVVYEKESSKEMPVEDEVDDEDEEDEEDEGDDAEM